MLLNLIHKLKCETMLLFRSRNPTSTFRNGDVFGALSERLPHPCASYLPICK